MAPHCPVHMVAGVPVQEAREDAANGNVAAASSPHWTSRVPLHPLRQPAHYLFVLPAVLVVLVLWMALGTEDVASPAQRILPWLLACLGAGLALLYHQMRTLCLLLLVAVVFALLHRDVGGYLRNGHVEALTPLRFHAISAWVPLLFAGLALWPERGRRHQDLLLRGVVCGVALVIFLLLAAQQPQGMHDLLSNRHWAWIPADWNALAQLPALLFLLATAALGWQAWRQPRPLHTAMLLALLCLWWMLPRIFLQPVMLPALSSAALLLMLGAMLQESFHMAFRDELTGLHNRRGLTLYLQECHEHGEGPPQALLLIDCDRFKQINDRHGHQAGDRVLQSMGNILRSMAGEQDLACRLGGDEFCLILRRGNHEIVQHAAEFILSAVHGLLERSHGTPHVSLVSIGASLLAADADWSEWYASADRALYRAKRDGGNCLRWVDDPDDQ